MNDIARVDGFKVVEHNYSEVLISPHLKLYSPVELKVVLKKPSNTYFIQWHDYETIVYPLKYVNIAMWQTFPQPYRLLY